MKLYGSGQSNNPKKNILRDYSVKVVFSKLLWLRGIIISDYIYQSETILILLVYTDLVIFVIFLSGKALIDCPCRPSL